ncbi:MAG: hypothetical protein AB1599_09980 [Planctomycetota bacterium]
MKNLLLAGALTAGILSSVACSGAPAPQETTDKPAPKTPAPSRSEAAPKESRRTDRPDMELMRKANKLMRSGVEAIQSGEYPKALQTYQELLTIIKEDNPEIGVVYYNTACVYSLLKDKTPALEYLAKAIKAGYDNREAIEKDPDLLFLKDMPEFKAVLDAIPPITALANTPEDEAAQKEAMEMIEKVHGLKFKETPIYKTLAPDMFARIYGGRADSIQGFYRWDDKTLYLKQGLDPVRFKGTRIHETFHALQDQLFNIGELHKDVKTTDENYALTALIEGDATLTFIECMPESMARMMLASATPWRMMGGEPRYDTSRNGEAAARQDSFGYSTAARFVQAIKEAKGWAGVNAMYTNLPKSTEQVLHPEKYLANEQPVEVSVPDIAATVGPDWVMAEQTDTLGEFGLLLGLLSNDKSGPLAEEAATGWAGDKLVFIGNKDTKTGFAIHKSVWDTEKDAKEYFDASVLVMGDQAQKTGQPLRSPSGTKDGQPLRSPSETKDGQPLRSPSGTKDGQPLRSPSGTKDGDTATFTNDNGNLVHIILRGTNVILLSDLPAEIKDKALKALE